MKIASAFPSKYLKAADIDGDMVFVIRDVTVEDVGGKGKPEDRKPVVYFQAEDRGLVLNKTNSSAIESIYGGETDDWLGKGVTLFSTKVEFAGKFVDGVRIRPEEPQDVPF